MPVLGLRIGEFDHPVHLHEEFGKRRAEPRDLMPKSAAGSAPDLSDGVHVDSVMGKPALNTIFAAWDQS